MVGKTEGRKRRRWTTQDEMVGWSHQLSGHESEQTLEVVIVVQSLNCVRVFETPWTVACQHPLSIEFFRQEHWCGLPLPTQGALSNPGVKPASLAFPASAGRFFTTVPPGSRDLIKSVDCFG